MVNTGFSVTTARNFGGGCYEVHVYISTYVHKSTSIASYIHTGMYI